uniref:Laccase n=1 Tax=Timema monikensis TaxID=170555 RepID=A0A7R9ECG5_9NEOP|nr:unnamed protein product [Timema monikensis]
MPFTWCILVMLVSIITALPKQNPDFPVIGSLIFCESDALDYAATEAGSLQFRGNVDEDVGSSVPVSVAVARARVFAVEDGVIAGGGSHACYRDCVEGVAMTCTYNFTITASTAMSYLCGDCPNNVSACSNPSCIAAGGIVRPVTVVNDRIPGPGIQVCLGDTVIVNVQNSFGVRGITLHWHGLKMTGNPYMDGAPYITQCPIGPHNSFQYKFLADTPGTLIWHSHVAMSLVRESDRTKGSEGYEEADGMFGALVVRRPLPSEPNSDLYDHDLAEHSVIVWHWYPEPSATLINNGFNSKATLYGAGLIINGKGGIEDFFGRYQKTFDTMPREVFTVAQGKRYRFRVVYNSAPDCPVQMSIDDHRLLVVATDSAAVEPIEVDSVILNAGERYDIVVTANQTVGNYWIRFRGLAFCNRNGVKVHQEAILRYEDADEELPTANNTYTEADREGLVLNPVGVGHISYPENSTVRISELTNIDLEQAQNITGVPDNVTYVWYRFNTFPSGSYPQLFNTTFSFPSFPLLTQRDSITSDMYCSGEVPSDSGYCSDGFCSCTNILNFPLDSLVELVIVDLDSFTHMDHPMHLHGTQFHVVAMETIQNITLDTVKQLNEQGGIPKKLTGPPLKDTVSVPVSGYAVIRFRVTNPGYWFFHCHISSHAALGMAAVFKFGEHQEMAPTPRNFPTCGDWQLPDN